MALTHIGYYADDIITKVDGETVDYALLSARRIWNAIGEQHLSPSAASHTNQSPMTLTEEHYNYAAKTIYGPHASISPLQLAAIMHLDNVSAEGRIHAFILMATGTGKSGLYNIPSAAAALYGNPIPKTLVISPHNGLLSQHCQQSTNYFRTLKVTITSLESSEVSESSDCPPDIKNTDVCFVSICGLHKLRQHHSNCFEQWGFQRIIIDEYHNIISEMFRFNSSWEGLRNISSLGVKIVCMSATGNEYIMKCVSRLLGLGTKYKLIGDTDQYKVPEVSILLSKVENGDLLMTVVEEVYHDFDQNSSTNHSAHVIVLSIDDAKQIVEYLQAKHINSKYLHSQCTREERQDVMRMWSDNQFQVLVSTIQDGIDSSQCKRVYVVGGSHNIIALIQSIGRIRPPQQSGPNATVKIFDTHRPIIDANYEEENKRLFQKAVGAGLVLPEDDQEKARNVITDLFTRCGYKKYIKTNECLRQTLFMKIGITSPKCQMCTNCLEKDNIIQTALAATKANEENESKKLQVFECLKKMVTTCCQCDRDNCSGKECLQSGSCFGCQKTNGNCNHRNKCTLKRGNLFQSSSGDRHTFCTWCFAPKTLEFQNAMGNQVVHRGDKDENGDRVQNCTLKERPKRLLLLPQTDDNRNTTEYLTQAFVSETAYYNFFHQTMERVQHSKLIRLGL